MKIISERERVEMVEFGMFFEYVDMSGAGYHFPCDSEGKVKTAELAEEALHSLATCVLNSEGRMRPPVLMRHEYLHTEPKIGVCDDCGRKVWLERFTNTCDCGADFNMSGQRLAPREQWGEETGETWQDIIGL